MATQPQLFDAPEPDTNAPKIRANRGKLRYGKGNPCTPALPGSGPEGETCGGCFLALRFHNYSAAKQWIKCAAMSDKHAGPGTDIKAKWPACKFWEPKDIDLTQVHRIVVFDAESQTEKWYGAAVYRRKGERPPQGDWVAEFVSVETLSIWWDYMTENGWRSLRVPQLLDEHGRFRTLP